MKKAFIFISFTNSQNQSIENSIIFLREHNVKIQDIFVITNTNDKFSILDPFNLIKLEKINSIKEAFKQVITRKNKIILYEALDKFNVYSQVEVLFPHFLNILSNHFYNFCLSDLNVKKIIISLYPDGFLSYYPFQIKSIYNIRNVKRYFTGILIGMRYKIFSGAIADPFNAVKKIYTYLPKATIPYNSKKILKISFTQNKVVGNNILLLGHFNQKKFSKVQISNYANMIENKLIGYQYEKIFYKPHPRLKDINSDLFYKSFKSNEKVNMTIINDTHPIEIILKNYKVSVIFASTSTSLINLKLKFKKGLDCYCFGIHNYIGYDYSQYIIKLFKELEIKSLDTNYD